MKLYEAARLIRSKNAGPFMLTVDILFETKENYERVRDSGVINVKSIADLYGLRQEEIRIFACEDAQALKVSFPRLVGSGDIGDTDVFGGQQHGPLVELEIL